MKHDDSSLLSFIYLGIIPSPKRAKDHGKLMEIEGTNSISSGFPSPKNTTPNFSKQDLPDADGSEAVAFQVNTGQLFVNDSVVVLSVVT